VTAIAAAAVTTGAAPHTAVVERASAAVMGSSVLLAVAFVLVLVLIAGRPHQLRQGESHMRAAIFRGMKDIRLGERPDPRIEQPTDAIVRVVRGCVCGSDLWYYRGVNPHVVGSIGHEFIGVVEQLGDAVEGLAVGDFVIAPFTYSDGTCPACQHGFQSNCIGGGAFGNGTIDGGQGELVRAPLAGSTLVKVPGSNFTDEQLASFTALSDVMSTGYHAGISAARGRRRGRRRRSGRPVRGHRRRETRRGAHHRAQPQPRPAGAGQAVRRDRHRRATR
jgi:hypothetical protein